MSYKVTNIIYILQYILFNFLLTRENPQVFSLWDDRFFPSSKTCSHCGYINQNLKLDMRTWICPSCNTILDRDINASKNILNEGLKIITSAGTADNRRGDEIRPANAGTIRETSKILRKSKKPIGL